MQENSQVSKDLAKKRYSDEGHRDRKKMEKIGGGAGVTPWGGLEISQVNKEF